MKPSAFREGATATGMAATHLPPGPARDEIIVLIRLGQRFRINQNGKKPGTLALIIQECTQRIGPPYSFERLLDEFELEAARREIHGERASIIEKVDRTWGLCTIHLPRRGRLQIPFGTLRNHLTRAKKSLKSKITVTAKP